jgi:hypothetical protein
MNGWWSTEIRILEFEPGIQWRYWMSVTVSVVLWVQDAKKNENESWLNKIHKGAINSQQIRSWQATLYPAVVSTNVGFGIMVRKSCLLSQTAYTVNCMAVDTTLWKRKSNVCIVVPPYVWPIHSKTYRGFVKQRLIPQAIHNVIFV